MGFRYINQDSDKMKKLKEINKFAEILGIHTFTTLKNYFYKGFRSVKIFTDNYDINDFYNVYKYILCKSFYNLLHINKEYFYLFNYSNIQNNIIKIEKLDNITKLPLLLEFNFFNNDIIVNIENNDCDNNYKLLDNDEKKYVNKITDKFNNITIINTNTNTDDLEYYKFTYKSKNYLIKITNLNNYLTIIKKQYNSIYKNYYEIRPSNRDPQQTSHISPDDYIKKDIIYKLLIAKLIYDMEKIIKEAEESKKTGGMNNKSYQLYIIDDRYFINYNKKRVYLTIKNTYKNNNQLFIKINKNTHIKIKII